MTANEEAEHFVLNILLADKSTEKQIELYNKFVDRYYQTTVDTVYRFPEILTQELETFNLARDSKILDVGAGTGFLGKLLHSLGYMNIDALDGSENMLQHSRKLTDVYKNFIQALVVEDKELPIPEKTYDIALMAGSASPAHIDVTAYKQIIRVVKPGGIIGWIIEDPGTCVEVNSRFQDNFYTKTLQKFTDEKLWIAVDGYNPKQVENASCRRPGDVYFYKIL